jgi:hypothetical protein
VRVRHPDSVLALGCHICGMALLDEAAPNEAGHLRLVLDDQHAHRSGMFAVADESRMRAGRFALTPV